MKRNHRNGTKMNFAPLKIVLSEDEILADLRYPVAADRRAGASQDTARHHRGANSN